MNMASAKIVGRFDRIMWRYYLWAATPRRIKVPIYLFRWILPIIFALVIPMHPVWAALVASMCASYLGCAVAAEMDSSLARFTTALRALIEEADRGS